jgi:hypothetical protein
MKASKTQVHSLGPTRETGCEPTLTKKYGKLGEPRRVGIQEVERGFMPVASIKSVGLKRSKSTS